jgi:hypothetical protein
LHGYSAEGTPANYKVQITTIYYCEALNKYLAMRGIFSHAFIYCVHPNLIPSPGYAEFYYNSSTQKYEFGHGNHY